jgi:predicted nucleotidyltransferase/biotin operon repressor
MLNILNISKTKWKIIDLLSREIKTQAELARELKISLAAISKEIKELLALGLIREVEKRQAKTKPYKCYRLNEFLYFVGATKEEGIDSKFLAIDDYLRVHLNIWKIPQKEFHYFIENFFFTNICNNKEIFANIESFAVFGSVAKGTATEGSDIDVLIITNDAKQMLNRLGGESFLVENNFEKKTKIIMLQIFEKDEFLESYKKGSKFVKEILSNMIIVYDKRNFLTNLKNEFAKRTS